MQRADGVGLGVARGFDAAATAATHTASYARYKWQPSPKKRGTASGVDDRMSSSVVTGPHDSGRADRGCSVLVSSTNSVGCSADTLQHRGAEEHTKIDSHGRRHSTQSRHYHTEQ